MSESAEHQVVLTTTDSREEAERLAAGMVREHLAACVQIAGPVTSVYRWEDEVQQDPEWQLWIKTATDRLDALGTWMDDNHSYDVPELVALPVLGGSTAYLTWVTEETR